MVNNANFFCWLSRTQTLGTFSSCQPWTCGPSRLQAGLGSLRKGKGYSLAHTSQPVLLFGIEIRTGCLESLFLRNSKDFVEGYSLRMYGCVASFPGVASRFTRSLIRRCLCQFWAAPRVGCSASTVRLLICLKQGSANLLCRLYKNDLYFESWLQMPHPPHPCILSLLLRVRSQIAIALYLSLLACPRWRTLEVAGWPGFA